MNANVDPPITFCVPPDSNPANQLIRDHSTRRPRFSKHTATATSRTSQFESTREKRVLLRCFPCDGRAADDIHLFQDRLLNLFRELGLLLESLLRRIATLANQAAFVSDPCTFL